MSSIAALAGGLGGSSVGDLSGSMSGRLGRGTPAGTPGYLACTNTATGAASTRAAVYPGAGAAPVVVTPQMLAAEAAAHISVGVPTPVTSPGLDRFQLVGLSTWLWVSDWKAVSRTAAVPGLSATVAARPTSTTWDMGDGSVVRCAGPGTPWRPALGDNQHTTCSHVFTGRGTYRGQVTVHWAVSWSASNGQAGTLPGIDRTAGFSIEVRSAQAVGD